MPFGTVSPGWRPGMMPDGKSSPGERMGGKVDGRVNWIDWLKVLIVFGVFLYHAAQPFVLTTWLVTDHEQSLVLSALAGIGYLFGMPLMFLLAGCATWLALGRRGTQGFLGLRIRRLLLPLILGVALLSPAQAWVAAGSSGSPVEFAVEYWRGANLFLDPRWLGDYGYHLWFLGFLFCYSLLALPAVAWLRADAARPARASEPFARGIAGVALLLVPIAAAQLVLRPLAPEYRDWGDFALWFGYLLIGLLAAAEPRLVRAWTDRRWWLLGGSVVFALGLVPAAVSGAVLDLEHAPGFGLEGAAYVVLRTALGYAVTLTFIGFAARYLTTRPRVIAWGSRAVLPFYVIHHPVVVVVAAWAVTLPLGLWPKFGLIVTLGLAGTLLLYEAGRRTVAIVMRGGRGEQPVALQEAEG